MRTIVRMIAVTLIALIVGVVVAGCGGSSSSSSSSSTGSSSNAARETAFLAYAQCMRTHGVAVSDPTVGANGVVQLPRPSAFSSGQTPTGAQRAQMQTARTACRSTLNGISFGFNPASNPQFQAAALKYAQCMRTNGVNMADPTFNSTPGTGGTTTTGGGLRGLFGGVNRNSPTFQKAQTTCRPILTAAGFGNRTGGGGGGFGGGTGATGSAGGGSAG